MLQPCCISVEEITGAAKLFTYEADPNVTGVPTFPYMSTVLTDPENDVLGTPNAALFDAKLIENFCVVPVIGAIVNTLESEPDVKVTEQQLNHLFAAEEGSDENVTMKSDPVQEAFTAVTC